VVAERVAADGGRGGLGGVELRGLEPLTFALPARRSGQLSYSPFECEVVSKVNACALPIPSRRQPESNLAFARDERPGQEEGAIEVPAIDSDKIDVVLAAA
jgi:hypothetical protein